MNPVLRTPPLGTWRRCAALAGAALLAGCVSRTREPAAPEPFVFRALDLRQQTGQGKPAWDLTSPEARYDLVRQLAQARQPRGVIYRRAKPHITVSALRGTVIGDGEAIQLEGDVQITLLGKNPVLIRGDQARWLPAQNLMVLDRRPSATDRTYRISAKQARYLLAEDLVELRGAPLLEQWSSRQDLRQERPPAPIQVRASTVDWRPEQGELVATGDVLGERFRQGRRARGSAAAELELTATGLRGNLRQGFIDLLEPVRLRDRPGSSWLHAGPTRWALQQQTLTSAVPFRGARQDLRASGQALRIDLAAESVLVPRGCRLWQPTELLTAQRCLWHWPSGRFEARGDVELRRTAYRQVTRSAQLTGRIGPAGEAVFSSPAARVQSRVTLPPKGAQRRSPTAGKPPVVF